MTLPHHVTIVEVGPRDGLQNEQRPVPTETKVELVERLAAAGLPYVEATSFVNPKAVPQLADAGEVMSQLRERSIPARMPVLVPNMRGYERAREYGVTDVAVFTAASETFNRRNTNASIAESIDRFRPVVEAAHADGAVVRGYISTALGCPFEGPVAPEAVRDVAARLLDIGIDELSIGDTIGAGVPAEVIAVCERVLDVASLEQVGLHLHDTRGTALANVWAGLELGITTYDSSAAGLGGCPFAPGATGNLATEDLVWFLHRNGIGTGVDLPALLDVVRWVSGELGRRPGGHIANTRLWPYRDEGREPADARSAAEPTSGDRDADAS